MGGFRLSWVGFKSPWVGSDYVGGYGWVQIVVSGCGAVGACGWSWFCSTWATASLGFGGCGKKWIFFFSFFFFGFVGMDLTVVAIDASGGVGCDFDCGGSDDGGWLWVVVKVEVEDLLDPLLPCSLAL